MTVPSAVGSGSNGRLVEVLMTFILCPCIVCRVSWVSARVVGVSRELGVWCVRKHEIEFCAKPRNLVCRVSWVSGA